MNASDWRNIGCTLIAGGNFHTAIAAFLRAEALGDNTAEFHREFAAALWGANDRDSAMREIHKAWTLDKGNLSVAINISTYLAAMSDYAGAAKFLSVALESKPDDAQARFNRSLYLLGAGDWERGWPEYDSRMDLYTLDFPDMGVPLWKGNASLDGKLIWVTNEQGVGDQIQFSRYVPWLQSKGASVIFDSRAELADFSFENGVITRTMGLAGKYKVPLHPTTGRKPDYQIPIMSLPSRHKTTPETVPPACWFKKVAEQFNVKIDGEPGKKKIGLIWAGSKEHPGDHVRSMPLHALIPLTGNNDCEFYSFQVGERAPDLETCGAQPLIHGLALRMWMQTAASLRHMDALVTVDTGCAHLAGAMGVKTFLMVSTEPDWRWGLEGDSTPWYPSFKIIRQEKRGDWAGVVRRVADELKRL